MKTTTLPLSKLSIRVLSTFALVSFSGLSPANERPVQFNVSSAGEYDSSVGLSELDDFTREGDSAWVLKAGINGTWKTDSLFSLQSRYQFTSRDYTTENDYDQRLHHISVNPKLDFGTVKAGIRHDKVKVALAGNDFLQYSVNALALEGKARPSLYLRLAFEQTDKSLANFSERNAQSDGWNGNMFWFDESAKHIISLSGKISREDARAEEYDFNAQFWKIMYTRKLSLGNATLSLKLSHSEAKRRYDFSDITTMFARRDNTVSNEISIEGKFNSRLELTAGVEWIDNSSTLKSVDYQAYISSVGIRLAL